MTVTQLNSRETGAKSWRGLILPAVVFAGLFGATTAALSPDVQKLLKPGALERPAASLREAYAPVKPERIVEAPVRTAPVDQHFNGCNAARAAGRENIPFTDPSYRSSMDGDGDGFACEPHRGY